MVWTDPFGMDLRSETASLAVSAQLKPAVLENPSWRRTRAREPKPLAVDVAAGLLGVGLGVTIALAVTAESWGALRASGGWSTAGGRLAGLVGAYLMLVVVLLAGRVPAIERSVGQDRLVRWHRSLAPWSLVLIAAHGALITVGYAEAARTGVLHQFGALIGTYPGILAATVAFILLIVAGFTSAGSRGGGCAMRPGGPFICTSIWR
jgi:Ferric reductase like transmembrane component